MAAQKEASQLVSQLPPRDEYNYSYRVTYGSSIYADRNRRAVKETLTSKDNPRFPFDPSLTTHIIKCNVDGIKHVLNLPTSESYQSDLGLAELSAEKLAAVIDLYKEDTVSCPLKLAIRMCASKTLGMTKSNDPTRYNVLYVLAENFDSLVAHAKNKGLYVPDLQAVMRFAGKLLKEAKNPDSNIDASHVNTAILTLINGLSDENKARVKEAMSAPQKTFSAVPA